MLVTTLTLGSIETRAATYNIQFAL
ncbi:MAG: hypothetical protein QOF90_1618, partial [Acetobacteraceae bacterium]|nr:hypothetical protein [Acetobacteraceae bacterium]